MPRKISKKISKKKSWDEFFENMKRIRLQSQEIELLDLQNFSSLGLPNESQDDFLFRIRKERINKLVEDNRKPTESIDEYLDFVNKIKAKATILET